MWLQNILRTVHHQLNSFRIEKIYIWWVQCFILKVKVTGDPKDIEFQWIDHIGLGGWNRPPFKICFPLFQISPSLIIPQPPYFATFCRRDILQHFVDAKGCCLQTVSLQFFMHGHSFTSNEPKNSWISLTSTMVGQNFEI